MSLKVRLDKLLLERGLVPSRERGQALILAGKVLVDGQKIEKAGAAVALKASVRILGGDLRYVSRGGLKLERALEHWKIEVSRLVCLDIGASTGGFTDCLLQHGAAKVIAVDTGYGQIDMRLRQDPRVRLLEKMNARYLKPEDISECVDLIVVDVSFISATLVLPAVITAGFCTGSEPGQRPGSTHPGSESGQRPGSTHPGSEPGQRPGSTHPGSEPGERPGSTHPSSEPGERPGSTHPGSEPGQRPGSTHPGSESGERPGSTHPGSEPGQRPGSTHPGIEPGQRPGSTHPSSESGRSPGSTRQLIVLVKPQFEVGRELVGKGGIVRDEAAQLDAVERVRTAVSGLGAQAVEFIESPIRGAEGNREFLLYARF